MGVSPFPCPVQGRRLQLCQDRFERVNPRRERKSLVIELLAQIFGERGGLFVLLTEECFV
jgi:hypothetical protein